MEQQLKALDNAKFMISELSKIQELYYDSLLDELDIVDGEEDWVFDYIFNPTEDSTFEEYLSKFGKELPDVIN